jgi:hypothetical protein
MGKLWKIILGALNVELFSHSKHYVINLTKIGFATILGPFSIKTSGHPVFDPSRRGQSFF